MRYTKFRIQNFKGIKDTTLHLEGIAGASVFAFVGLNESGKTTILEAIHSFSPDSATSELVGGDKDSGVPYAKRVPRHLISSFTGRVSVAATLSMNQSERETFAASLLEEHNLVLDIESLGEQVVFERFQTFKDGDLQGAYLVLMNKPNVKSPKQRKWRTPNADEHNRIRLALYQMTPDISYFPTFVFDFPERIFLTDQGNNLDAFYRRVFQDILDYDGKGYTVEKDIIRRVRSETLQISWLSFLNLWSKHPDVAKIQHVMDRASATVTKVVSGRWNEIFGEDTRGKEIVIDFDVAEGETKDKGGIVTKNNSHDVHVKFEVRDGTRRFDVNDRSLGFRWFFAFMLFTQFRVARSASRPLLFLFDEPASNLHAAAQQKLIDCFPDIARGQHALIYTTHSHYMIEPKWLEQTYIISNRSDAPPDSILDAISLDDESLDVKVESYRSFVDSHPGQTSYFQPILDRLEVVPSRLDTRRAAVILEGRSDYYVLRYAAQLLNIDGLPLMPGLGVGTFGALAAMHVGWDLNFLFVLDADPQGRTERDRYGKDFGILPERLALLSDFIPQVKQIEDLLDEEAERIIAEILKIPGRASKPQIKRFFQERLAGDNIVYLGEGFAALASQLLSGMNGRLNEQDGGERGI